MKLIDIIKAVFGHVKDNPDSTRDWALTLLADVKELVATIRSLLKAVKEVRPDVKAQLETIHNLLKQAKETLDADAKVDSEK